MALFLAYGKLRAVDAAPLHPPAGRAEFVPGCGCALDSGPLHQVGAQPQHVGGGVADAGGGVHAGLDLVDPVGACEEPVAADGFDDRVERGQQSGMPVVGDREGGQVRHQVRHVAPGERGGELGRIPFVGGLLEQHPDPRMPRLEGGDLESVGGELFRR